MPDVDLPEGVSLDAYNRLPRWARHMIERDQANARHWKAKATAGPENSDTFLGPHAIYDGHNARPLGSGETVTFVLSDGVAVEARVLHTRGVLEVRGVNRSLADHLTVRPSSTNVAHIGVGD